MFPVTIIIISQHYTRRQPRMIISTSSASTISRVDLSEWMDTCSWLGYLFNGMTAPHSTIIIVVVLCSCCNSG